MRPRARRAFVWAEPGGGGSMPETGYSQAAKVHRGALVQLVPDIVGIVPNIVTFQYNPEKITRGLEPWNPFEVDQTKRGSQAPTVQPYDPEETFSFTLEFDAADALEDGNPLAIATGIAGRLAALKKLTLPTKGLIGDLAASARALFGGGSSQAVRPTVPIVLLRSEERRVGKECRSRGSSCRCTHRVE